MPKISKSKSQRLRQSVNAVRRAENFSLKQVKTASRKLLMVASRVLRSRSVQDLDLDFVKEYQPALAKALLIVDLQARLQLRKLIPETNTLQLSYLTETVKQYRKLNPRKLEALAQHYNTKAFTILDGVSAIIEAEVRKAIADSIEAGEHVKDGVARLQETFQRVGISARNPFHLETLIRTNSQLAFGAAKWAEAQDPDIAAILWGYEYNTVGDNRVRDEHADLDGTRLPKEHAFWQTFYPPNGWNCRCQAIEIFTEEPVVYPRAEPIADETFNTNPGNLLPLGVR